MRIKSFLLVVSLICLPLSAHALQPGDALLEKLYEKAGWQKAIEQIPASIQQGFDQRLANDPSAQAMDGRLADALKKSFAAVFVPGQMKAIFLDEFRTRLTKNDVELALEWVESPLGSKIKKAEEVASDPGFIKKLPPFLRELRKSPPSPDRLNVLGRLDRATKSSETAVEIAMGVGLASAVAMVAALPDGPRTSMSQLQAAIERSRPQIETMIRTQMGAYFLYMYRAVSIAELETYLAFFETTAGKKLNDAGIAGLVKALLTSIAKLEGAIAKELRARKI